MKTQKYLDAMGWGHTNTISLNLIQTYTLLETNTDTFGVKFPTDFFELSFHTTWGVNAHAPKTTKQQQRVSSRLVGNVRKACAQMKLKLNNISKLATTNTYPAKISCWLDLLFFGIYSYIRTPPALYSL